MLPVPCAEHFPVGAVLGKVISSATLEAPLLLSLIVIHSLHHLHVQPLYLFELQQLSIRGLHTPYLRIWQEQLFIFEGGDSPCRCGIPLVPISVGISEAQPSLVGMQGLPHLQLLCQFGRSAIAKLRAS